MLVTGAGPVGLGVILAPGCRLRRRACFRSQCGTSQDSTKPGCEYHPVGETGKRFALIVECSGAHAARNLGVEVVLPRGALVLVGENAAPWTVEEGKVFRRKDFFMIRTFYFPIDDFEPNIALFRRYKDEYRVLVDGEFGFELPQNFAPVRKES